MSCEHEDWTAQARVIRATETESGAVTGWCVELEMSCVTCLTPMQWAYVEDAAGGFVLQATCQPFSLAAIP